MFVPKVMFMGNIMIMGQQPEITSRVYNIMAYNFIFHLLIAVAAGLQLNCNYNYSLVHEFALLSQPLLLSHRVASLQQRPPLIENFPLRKYELKDTGYHIEDSSLSPVDHMLLYQMEPPAGVFPFEVMSIQNYRLLQIRQFPIILTNPSQQFKICINQILIDSQEVRRNDERGSLPLCLSPKQSQQFNFSIYIASSQPGLIRITVYFIVDILDGKMLVQEKVYARKVYTNVQQNHFQLENNHFKNCPQAQNLHIHNYEHYQIMVKVQSRRRLYTTDGRVLQSEISLRPGQQLEVQLQGKSSQLIIHSYGKNDQKLLPSLMVKTICDQPLIIDYYNVGILIDQRMVIDLPLTVTSKSNLNITLLQIQLQSTSQTIELQERREFTSIVYPFAKYLPIAMMKIHSSKNPDRRSTITVRIKYEIGSQQRTSVQRFVYAEIRNAVSVGQKRFIDVTKQIIPNKAFESRIPIKNNLNVPIYLNRILIDDSLFKLSWQSDRRRLIYPNHSSQQFSLTYIGPLSLPLSSLKYLALLEFNGHLLIPLQITIYDHTLQCLYENVVYKCSMLPPLDFGYFRDANEKSKQFVVRNWNPQPKVLTISINQTQIQLLGYNVSLRVYRPGLSGDHQKRQSKSNIELLLKANQFLLLNIDVQPYQNATTGNFRLSLSTPNENVHLQPFVRYQNGTIALIPQIIRFSQSFQRQIQYINLVSTFSQQYNIKQIRTNLTGLSVHFTPPQIILQNQWVGMSVVYDPIDPSANISHQFWQTPRQQLSFISFRKAKKYQKIKYAKIKLTTTTELEASSIAIIEQKGAEMIKDIKQGDIDGVYDIQKRMIKRRKKFNKKQERFGGQIKIVLDNPFDLPLKYTPLLLSPIKFKELQKINRLYQFYSKQQLQQGFFCISQELKSKWNISPSTLTLAFKLNKAPEECYLQSTNSQIFLATTNRQKIELNSSSPSHSYLLRSFRKFHRTCFRIMHKNYLNWLIDTELINKILEDHGLTILTDFIKVQLNHSQDIRLFQLDYLEMHHRLKQDFQKLCSSNLDMIVFRFCHYLNVRVVYVEDSSGKKRINQFIDKSIIIPPQQTHTLIIQTNFPLNQDFTQFFMVLQNNFTVFETYRVTVSLQDANLKLYPLSTQYDSHPKSRIPIRKRSDEILILLNYEDYHSQQLTIAGSRVFQLVNEGSINLEINHIGIQQKEFTCEYGSIWINDFLCKNNQMRASEWNNRASKSSLNFYNRHSQSIVIRPQERHNITINYQFILQLQSIFKNSFFPVGVQYLNTNVYLYDEKGYYFRLKFRLQIGDRELKSMLQEMASRNIRQPLIGYTTLNILCCVIVGLIVFYLKGEDYEGKKKNELREQQQSHYNKIHRGKRYSKIVRESVYSHTDSSIGTRLLRKTTEKPVHSISQDLLLSVRELKQRELKKYFNESQQSEIGGNMGFNHHLSLSQSISYQQQEHDNNIQQKEINENTSSPNLQEEDQSQVEPSNSSDSSSAVLPDGEEVDITQEIDTNSQFDFNQQNSFRANKNNQSNSFEQDQFYNVFRSQIGLKKQPQRNYHKQKGFKTKRD